eukprot:6177606-Pleurochrysis_carterae.AAC.3
MSCFRMKGSGEVLFTGAHESSTFDETPTDAVEAAIAAAREKDEAEKRNTDEGHRRLAEAREPRVWSHTARRTLGRGKVSGAHDARCLRRAGGVRGARRAGGNGDGSNHSMSTRH